MRQWYPVVCVTGLLAVTLLLGSACSKKNVQATADTLEGKTKVAAKAGSSAAPAGPGTQTPKLAETPPEPPGSAPKSEPLTGFEPTRKGAAPPEERIPGGTVIAKAEPSESAKGGPSESAKAGLSESAKGGASESARERMKEMQQEQAARTAADVAGTSLEDVYFGFDSWKIVELAKQSLERDAAWLKANPDMKLTIEGHCDERGTLEYNLVLGEKRAKSVQHYLTELGVEAGRLHVTSFGKEKPFCREHREACHQMNRRGHLVVRTQ